MLTTIFLSPFLILVASLIQFTKGVEVQTGEDSIYNHKQTVNIGYINVGEEANLYYQYFKSLNEEGNKHLTFFVGYNVSISAQAYGFMGYIPYTIQTSKRGNLGVELSYNSMSLNSNTDLVVVDIVRGGGFSNNLVEGKVDFDKIEKDLAYFIKTFRDTYKIDSKIISTVYAAYEMIQPAVQYVSNSKIPVNLILQNPWLGYSSFSQLYYELPAYGVTGRGGLDMISNKIYSLMSSDYGKDLDRMTDHVNEIRSYLMNDIPVDCNNPSVDQSFVQKFFEGLTYFLEECKTCRAFCSLQKGNWNTNSTLREMMMKDLVFDRSTSLVSMLQKSLGNTLIVHGKNTLLGSIQPLIEISPSLGTQTGPSGASVKSELGSTNAKITLKLLQEPGFYPFIDSPELMVKTIGTWFAGNVGNEDLVKDGLNQQDL